MHGFDYSIPLFVTRIRGTRIVVTPNIVSEVLRILKVEHPNYPGCEHIKTVSKDELMSTFCERPSDWGDLQFTPCLAFAKGPCFLNMVMTFILHPLSHYNSTTKPRAWFLLSLLEHLTIDFPSHIILSIIEVYRDTATRDKLIFPSAITRILRHFSIPFIVSEQFHVMCAIDAAMFEAIWVGSSSHSFNSIHLHSLVFYGRCDSWCNHGAILVHGCSPWHSQW